MTSITLNNGVLHLNGELDHDSVNSLRMEAARLLKAEPAGSLELDCTGVTRANSAGLALLLAILRDAGRLGKTISIGPLPADMQQMIHVCELDAVLYPAS